MNPGVDLYLAEGCGRCALGGTPQCKVHLWPEELKKLRAILLDCGLEEEVKWKVPCYTYRGHNIAVLAAFKEYCALSFFKGSLLQDAEHLLSKPGENTQGARIIRITGISEIVKHEAAVRAYIFEAIEIEKAGLKVDFKEKKQLDYPDELLAFMKKIPALKKAFEALTPGRQRGYLLHFTSASQPKTRESRIEKCIPKILAGKGFNDR